MLAAALRLVVDQGLYVFPVDHPSTKRCRGVGKGHNPDEPGHQRGKHPACKWSEWSTNDPELLVTPRYFGGREPRNVGVDCGKSGIVGIDEDKAGEVARFEADTGLSFPATYKVRTRDGRHHLYYNQIGGVEPLTNSEGALADYAINVRGKGGFLVAAGSLHATGVTYTVVEDVGRVELPCELYDRLAGRKRDSDGNATGERERSTWWREGKILAGKRQPAALAAAGWCRTMGLRRDEAVPVIRDVWSRFDGDKYTLEDAWAVLEDVYDRYPAGYRFDEKFNPELVDAPSGNGHPPPSDTSDTSDALLGALRTGAWLDVQHFPPLRYHLPGVIPEGSTLLVGPPKIGKSWFVLALALATSSAGRALGMDVEKRPTLYLALEDGDRRMQSRCRALLGLGRQIPPAFEYLTRVQPMHVLATLDAWLARHRGEGPLVIVDTLGKVMPPALMGESAYQRDYRVGSALKRLVDDDPGAAIVVNHHDRKAGSEDFVDRVSGTNGLAGSADTVVVLARARHDDRGRLHVTGRDVAEGEYAVRFNGADGVWSLDGDDLADAARKAREDHITAALDELSTRLLLFVEDRDGPVRAADAVDAGLFDDTDTAGKYLRRLAESGRIVKTGRGVFTRQPLQPTLSEVSDVSETKGTA